MKDDVISALQELISGAAPEKKFDWNAINPEIQFQGRAITLPGDPGKMPVEKAIEALTRLAQSENTTFKMHEIIDAYPQDALVALHKAMAKLYGWASVAPGGFFRKPPTMMTIKTGVKDTDVVQCAYGEFVLPGLESSINVAFDSDGRKSFLVVYGTFRKKHQHILLELVNEARRIVREESIYKGKAVRLAADRNGTIDMMTGLSFFDTANSDPVILDQDIRDQVNTSILVPIQNSDECRKNRIPLRRNVLLSGPYGTGKSLTAREAAQACEANGWTFIMLDRVQGLRESLEFASRYAPAVVFAEDIDRVMEDRDEDANDLINTINGVLTNSKIEIMTVLTTNFPEKIAKAMLRPGRLDDVIEFRPPGPKAAQQLMRHYAGSLLDPSEDLVPAGMELAGQIPASIRECVERAKLGMVGRRGTKLVGHDLVVAAKTMKNHLALLNRDNTKTQTAGERLAGALKEIVSPPVSGDDDFDVVKEQVKEIHQRVC